jgi:4-amino-4-deoxychorismate lyase
MTDCWINGQPASSLPLDDRGLHYGDGLFETMAIHQGQCPWFGRHYQRLRLGCEQLDIPLPDATVLLKEVNQAAAGQDRAVLKLILTTGSGGRGYRRPADLQPRRILLRSAWPHHPASHWQSGVAVRLCRTRLSPNPALAGSKHLNRLEQVLARNEWQNDRYAEGLMRDQADHLVDGTMSNLFIVRDGVLATPVIDNCGVNGVMRRRVLELATELGIETAPMPITQAMLEEAEEVMLSNALIGLWPVREFEGQSYAPGPVHRRLLSALYEEYPVLNA